MKGMAGRVALVTGSTRGIGKAVAHRLTVEGARVIVHGRDQAAVDRVVREIGGVLGVVGDISEAGRARAICQYARDRVGTIDIVVNNAGTSTRGFFLRSTEPEWDLLFAVNVHGPRNLLREVIPGMQERGWGRILNMTSAAAIRGTPGFSAYAASKGALLAMSLTLADELYRFGIRVNAMAPLALTDLARSQLSLAALASLTARGFPSVEKCAEAALHLVAEDAPNGQLTMMDFEKQPVGMPLRLWQSHSGAGARGPERLDTYRASGGIAT